MNERIALLAPLNQKLPRARCCLPDDWVSQVYLLPRTRVSQSVCPVSLLQGTLTKSQSNSELELKASLEELGIAFEVESIQMSNAIGANKAQIVCQVPIHHRSESPKFSALQGAAV